MLTSSLPRRNTTMKNRIHWEKKSQLKSRTQLSPAPASSPSRTTCRHSLKRLTATIMRWTSRKSANRFKLRLWACSNKIHRISWLLRALHRSLSPARIRTAQRLAIACSHPARLPSSRAILTTLTTGSHLSFHPARPVAARGCCWRTRRMTAWPSRRSPAVESSDHLRAREICSTRARRRSASVESMLRRRPLRGRLRRDTCDARAACYKNTVKDW